MSPRAPLARAGVLWQALTGAAATVGLVWQLVLTVTGAHLLLGAGARPPGQLTRIVRYLSYFTVESNILVAVVAFSLVLDPGRNGPIWRAARLASLFGITVTGVVAATLLRGTVELHGAAVITDLLLHTVSPIMAILGFLVFGPRGRITENTLVVALVWPALYVAYTLAHGAATDWYPYPFIDAHRIGYVTAVRNGVGVVLLLVGIGALYAWADRRLPGGRSRPGPM